MTKNILFQGITHDGHVAAVRNLLRIPEPQRIIMCVAFLSESGLAILNDALAPVAAQTTVLAGIRNGITSAQGLRKSLQLGCSTYAVDTGSRSVLFHPKIYLSRNDDEARLIVGSANLTLGGLNSNIEASLVLTANFSEPDDVAFLAEVESRIDGMIGEYSENVFPVLDDLLIQQLLDSGRVVDESIAAAPNPVSSARNRDLDTVSKMRLKTRPMGRPRVARFPTESSAASGGTAAARGAAASVRERWSLVWESRPLTRRDLNIPTGSRTHATGSMFFSKGVLEGIDQRHYFRDAVFHSLDWNFDTAPNRQHMERAWARFRLVIRDVDYGIFTLRLSHNSRTDTRSYEQRNSMTQLHWGEALPNIAREDLLGRIMFLYRDAGQADAFILEID